jgi:hypothetical protein
VTDAPRPVRASKDLAIPPEIAQLVQIEAEKRDAAQKEKLAAYYRSVSKLLDGPRRRAEEAQRAARRAGRADLQDAHFRLRPATRHPRARAGQLAGRERRDRHAGRAGVPQAD